MISINFAQFSGLTLCRPEPLRSGRIEAECEVDGTAVGRRSTIKTFAPRNPSIQFFRLTCQEVDVHQGAGRCVVVAANVVGCRLAGDDYIIEVPIVSFMSFKTVRPMSLGARYPCPTSCKSTMTKSRPRVGSCSTTTLMRRPLWLCLPTGPAPNMELDHSRSPKVRYLRTL